MPPVIITGASSTKNMKMAVAGNSLPGTAIIFAVY